MHHYCIKGLHSVPSTFLVQEICECAGYLQSHVLSVPLCIFMNFAALFKPHLGL